jgi:hypothetical protein
LPIKGESSNEKSLILCLLIFLLLMGVLFYAEFSVSTPTASASQSARAETETRTANQTTGAATHEKEIRAILERYYEIAQTGDREALMRFSSEISAPEYRYSSELGVMDKAAAIRHFDALDIEFVRAEFDKLTVQIYGDDGAIAKYRDISTVRTNGILTNKPMQFTNVWVKQNGAWKIVAEHSSVAAPSELLPLNRFPDNLARK